MLDRGRAIVRAVCDARAETFERSNLPSPRHGSDFAIDHRQALAAGGAEMDEPFLENAPRHLLQDRDPPRVVFDEVVVGGYSAANQSLNVRWIPFDAQALLGRT